MDIEKFIPNQSEDWYIKYNTIYYKKGGSIPILKRIDGITFVSLDRRVIKQVILMINKLDKLSEPFLMCDRLTIDEKNIYKEDLARIIDNYLYVLEEDKFFRHIKNSDFDFVENLVKFLDKFNCHKLFKYRYDMIKKHHYNHKWMDWYTRKEVWTVKNEEIRDYYSTLERQIKLNIFFS